MNLEHKIEEIDLAQWVAGAPEGQESFRQAVHIVLTAISDSSELRARMVMKGGMLMAIRYHSDRYTTDADFSTHARYIAQDKNALVAALDQQITLANEKLTYDTVCRLQRHEVRPARADASFPTVSCSIGYARRSRAPEMKRLASGQSATVVKIECSYNEAVLDVETLRFTDDGQIQVYSYLNLFAEKLRALLQQPERNRARRQDVYDLHFLLSQGNPLSEADSARLLSILKITCEARGIAATVESINDPRVIQLARQDYDALAAEITGSLPPFDEAYRIVADFYRSLPWGERPIEDRLTAARVRGDSV